MTENLSGTVLPVSPAPSSAKTRSDSRRSGSGRRSALLSSTALLHAACVASFMAALGAPAGLAVAQPTNPAVVSGAATFRQSGPTYTIRQASDKAIIQWSSFGNQAGETIRFDQPGQNSAVLNRVTGGDMTRILGSIQANGKVFVINPNGVLVGAGARIDTGGFLASTLDVADDAFLAGGDLLLKGGSQAGIVNLGDISAGSGDVLLVARTVANHGTITAAQGLAGLAAGTEVLYKPAGEDRIFVRSSAGAQSAVGIDQQGVIAAAAAELKAAGGNAYALAVNSAGSIQATGIEDRGGRIVLTAAGGDVEVSGDLTARRADGSGGTVLVGGDYQGSNAADVPAAANVTVTASARIAADGDAEHDGGKVVVWSDGLTRMEGRISATGAQGGNAEVSGRTLAFRGLADLRGAQGGAGTLLLDPNDEVIDAADAGTLSDQLNLSSVKVEASNSITLLSDSVIKWSAGTTLTLDAGMGSTTLYGTITGRSPDSALSIAGHGDVYIGGNVGAGSIDIPNAYYLALYTGATLSAFGSDMGRPNGILSLGWVGDSSSGGGMDF
ncbi:MAG: filamentous hemagglutinin N-terminal domain-containing protein, partial [Novosphingobium sp.]|nr:filamentous hemagglutinin N-terminal domain-containing protein [Novosphingobium sp.]